MNKWPYCIITLYSEGPSRERPIFTIIFVWWKSVSNGLDPMHGPIISNSSKKIHYNFKISIFHHLFWFWYDISTKNLIMSTFFAKPKIFIGNVLLVEKWLVTFYSKLLSKAWERFLKRHFPTALLLCITAWISGIFSRHHFQLKM